VFLAFGEKVFENEAWHGENLRFGNVFRNDMATWIWTEMMVVACEDEEQDEHEGSAVLLDLFFDQLKIPKKNGQPFKDLELQSWRGDTAKLWRIWCSVSTRGKASYLP
jgi:hypothetical protein